MDEKPCSCGSGEPRYPINDGHGIFLTMACSRCEEAQLAKYRPDVMERYDADEPIEPNE